MTRSRPGTQPKRSKKAAAPKKKAGKSPPSKSKGRKKALEMQELELEPGKPIDAADLPRATIVVLNHNGRHHLAGCFESLAKMAYPKERLEVVLVDNGSSDGSLEAMRRDHSWVRVVANEKNVGFSAGCNQGARLAERAEVVVFLNNDMRVEPNWLSELVAPLVREECAATTAKMFSWDGKKINSAGGGMNFHGIGIQHGYMEEPTGEFDRPRRTLFACGGAMAIRAEVFADVGGFDPEFFAYYEDVDLGWRLWVLGHEVHYVPSAVCYHHHSSTSRSFPLETVRLLQVRNPILACVKNYDADNLRRVLPTLLALAMRRMFLVSGLSDVSAFRIEEARGERPGLLARLGAALGLERAKKALADEVPLSRVAVADLVGINDLLGNWRHWTRRREEVQSRRRRADEEIFRLFLKPFWCIEGESAYQELQEDLCSFNGIDQMFAGLTIEGRDPHK